MRGAQQPQRVGVVVNDRGPIVGSRIPTVAEFGNLA